MKQKITDNNVAKKFTNRAFFEAMNIKIGENI